MNKPTIYISGPISNDPEYKAKFKEAQDMLEQCGFCVLSPAEEIRVEPWKEWADYMAEALILLLQCDQVYMLKGWSTSTGACLEMKLAKKLGKLVKFA